MRSGFVRDAKSPRCVTHRGLQIALLFIIMKMLRIINLQQSIP